MAAEKDKKYFWLKLNKDFFKRPDVRIIEAMPDGKEYILFYLKLLCESVDHEGNLMFNDSIAYDEDMLATITGTDVDIVKNAIAVFSKFGMIQKEDGTFYMREAASLTGNASGTESAYRQRLYRERKRISSDENVANNATECNASVTDSVTENATECNANVTKSVTQNITERNTGITKSNESIEIEKEIETDIEKEIERKKGNARRFAPPSVEEVRSYCQERDNNIDAEQFVDFYASKGWKVGNTNMKDWKACVRTWEKRDKLRNPRDKLTDKTILIDKKDKVLDNIL